MRACASASGGVIFIPETLERTSDNVSNDNGQKAKIVK